MPDIIQVDLDPEMPEGLDPGGAMQIVGVDQRAVDIEDHRFRAHGSGVSGK